MPTLIERISLLIWKIKHHDEIVHGLEADLEKAQDEIERLKREIEKLKGEKT